MIKVLKSKIIVGSTITQNTVEEVDSYKDYYKHLECGTFDVVMVNWRGHDISLYVDDEGLMKANNYGRTVRGYPNPLFGIIVVAGGVDVEGNTLSVPDEINVDDLSLLIDDVAYFVRGDV